GGGDERRAGGVERDGAPGAGRAGEEVDGEVDAARSLLAAGDEDLATQEELRSGLGLRDALGDEVVRLVGAGEIGAPLGRARGRGARGVRAAIPRRPGSRLPAAQAGIEVGVGDQALRRGGRSEEQRDRRHEKKAVLHGILLPLVWRICYISISVSARSFCTGA